MPHNDPFAFLENSTTRALLGSASIVTGGPGFLDEALGMAATSPELIGESLRKLSIGNTLVDAFKGGEQESRGSSQRQPDAQPKRETRSQRPPSRQLIIGGRSITNVSQLQTRQEISDAISRLREMGKLTPELGNALLQRQSSLPR